MKPREAARYAALTLLVTVGATGFLAWIILCGWLLYHLIKWLPA